MECFNNSTPSALFIPEILEMILEHLSPSDLLCKAQRVSFYWRSSIEQSPRLQRNAFLRLAKAAIPDELFEQQEGSITYFEKTFGLTNAKAKDMWLALRRTLAKDASQYGSVNSQAVFINNFLGQYASDQIVETIRARDLRKVNDIRTECLHPVLQGPAGESLFFTGYGDHLIIYPCDSWAARRDIGLGWFKDTISQLVPLMRDQPEASSWREAQITYPACTELSVCVPSLDGTFGEDTSLDHYKMIRHDGIRVEDLFEILIKGCSSSLRRCSEIEDWTEQGVAQFHDTLRVLFELDDC
ncbi:hypothetical protein BS50DRAFT_634370 [Corynespora cassiicola Philippines]|uniref:F-box domain-containing protein n=1 Tax=Corynespora cassiicola Philippines TaxID=1448308 RepID=A0A2T2NNC3_CORCC|nr:hypothetical protein BS50DRAFT_634370 [Corynespora cassiicola Philippines]